MGEGHRAKDIAAIMLHHAPDVRSFDCHSQLQLKGAEVYRGTRDPMVRPTHPQHENPKWRNQWHCK
jgi:ketosteroid isomerase-like protein